MCKLLLQVRKDWFGTKELNKKVQELINSEGAGKKEKQSGQTVFREGDNVMQMKNNYDIEWEQEGEIGMRNFQWRNGKGCTN